MSHATVRGEPYAAQLYLDKILDAILEEKGIQPDPEQRDLVTLPQVIYYCLKKRPANTFMTNGTTGEVITNEQLLKRSVSLARALTEQGMRGKHGILWMRSHQYAAAVYFANLLAGVKTFIMDPNATVFELKHFLNLIEPSILFCDSEYYSDVQEALQGSSTQILVSNEPEKQEQFARGGSDDVFSYQVPDASPEDTILYLPTSGSTGLPKAAMMTNRGLVMQLPSMWAYHTKFPTPTGLVMITSTMQWVTFTMTITSCVTYQVPVLMWPQKNTVEVVSEMLIKYRPTWTYLNPPFALELVASATPDLLSSLETLILLGSPASPELIAALKKQLPKTAHLCNGYGSTEAQGFMVLPERDTLLHYNGRLINLFYYKLVDENEQDLGLNGVGELYVKGKCTIKGYYNNEESTRETFTPDGWYKTGDIFHVDEDGRFFYVIRKKFTFKYYGAHVAPEEVESVVGSVPGVHECVVCGTNSGPAAAVVLLPSAQLTRDDIRRAVDSKLSDHKRLRGGIAFVESLPHTHSGKLKRPDCTKLVEDLIKKGMCY